MANSRLALDSSGIVAEIVVKRAALSDGNERARLEIEAEAYITANKIADPLVRFALQVTWPALRAGTVDANVTIDGEPLEWPLPLDRFARFGYPDELPDELIEAWIEAVYARNPHWRPGFNREADQAAREKKAPTSTPASGPSTASATR